MVSSWFDARNLDLKLGREGGCRAAKRSHLFETLAVGNPGHCAPDVFHHNSSRTRPRGLLAERIIKKPADWFAAQAPGGSSWQWMSARQLGISFCFFFFLKSFRSYSLNLLLKEKPRRQRKIFLKTALSLFV